MSSKSHLAKRLARLEDAFAQQQVPIERETLIAGAASFTRGQRRARIRELIHRLMKVRGIEPAGGESTEDAAVRAFHTIRTTPSSSMIEALRAAYTETDGDLARST